MPKEPLRLPAVRNVKDELGPGRKPFRNVTFRCVCQRGGPTDDKLIKIGDRNRAGQFNVQ